jgi:glycine/D-amino acid oxidase-like deaminating enzyme/nitrite reductase/ring-hydroxylating ferredoxin subunit
MSIPVALTPALRASPPPTRSDSVRNAAAGEPIAFGIGMKLDVGTLPYWIGSAPMPAFPKLERDETVDVVVVGGGITGLTAAYLLTVEGRRVALLEREGLAEIDTGHTSAHLTMVTDDRLSDLEQRFGRDHARAAWDAGLAAIAQIDAIAQDLDLDCDFEWVPGYLHGPIGQPAADAARMFQSEARLASELGFDAEFADEVPFVGGPGVRFHGQARFHPRKYLAGLARAIVDRGGMIFDHSPAGTFKDKPRAVTSNGHTLTCDSIVIATHTPLVGNADMLGATLFQTKLALYTSYVVAGRIAKGQIPDALYWDTADPYHYLRLDPQAGHDLVIFGGEDHKTGQVSDTTGCIERLERTLLSMIDGIDITHRWSGQVVETPDGLPYIGETAEQQFAGTGYAGNGLTFGTLTGMMATDRILGRTNPWSDLFDPARKKVVGGAWDYIAENKDYPYYMVRDRLAGAEGRSLREVPRGTGKIIEAKGQTLAVYRDDRGKTLVRSAVCTHMGCLVNWNQAERTWDCPCHGSRFKPDGAVIAGPAEAPLPEAE